MAKYRKKPVVIDAEPWFKNGDHSQDACEEIIPIDDMTGVVGEPFMSEGKIVRYFRHPVIDGEGRCVHCGIRMHEHGWIDTLEGGHTVCPADWIITGIKGERYPCKPDIFKAIYEPVE